MTFFFKRSGSSFLVNFISPLVAIGLGGVLFFLAVWPVHTINDLLPQYFGLEQDQNGVKYAWLGSETLFHPRDIPRYAPIYAHFSIQLRRPPEVPPLKLTINESTGDTGSAERNLATYDGTEAPFTWQDFIIKIPPSESSSDKLFLYFRSNGFKVMGDPRTLGVSIKELSFEVKPSSLVYLVWPHPYLPAVFLLMVGMARWCFRVKFSFGEVTALLATIGFAGGALANTLAYQSFPLLIIALLLVAGSFQGTGVLAGLAGKVGWFRPDNLRLQKVQKKAALRFWLPVFAAAIFFAAFFLLAPGLPGDIFYWREVLDPILNYGPVGVYSHAPRLVYPPGSVFFLWIYGIIARPFGLAFSQVGLKALMGFAHFALLGLLWYTGRRYRLPVLATARAFLLLAFSLSLVFVPLSWVQADAWLVFLMILPLLLAQWKKPTVSILVQVLAVLYKAQSWLLLPLYGLGFLWRTGWRKSLALGAVGSAGVLILGGIGFGFNPDIFYLFWNLPPVSGESGWGGIRSFNLLHVLGYDQKQVPNPWLGLSYASVALVYGWILGRLWQNWRKNSPDGNEREENQIVDWLFAAGLFFLFLFFLWVKMHERYLYFGLLSFLLWACGGGRFTNPSWP